MTVKKTSDTVKTDGEVWKLPPRIKVLEAMGAIADRRIVVGNNDAVCKSSMGDRTYHLKYRKKNGRVYVSSDDNGSRFKGYLGYPSIALLMVKGDLPLNKELSELLKGIKWKELNERFKNYYKVEYVVKKIVERRSNGKVTSKDVDNIIEEVIERVKRIRPLKLTE